MSSTGDPLFRSYRPIKRLFEELPVIVHHQIGELLDEERQNQTTLFDRLWAHHQLEYLWVSSHQWTKVGIPLTAWVEIDGERQYRYLMEAHVQYTGSKILWKTRLDPDVRFALKGRIGKTTAKLCGLTADKDVAKFEKTVSSELTRLSDALFASRPQIDRFNDQIRSIIESGVRTY